jgi:predicted  nucleic acid-binding Zn-ribbon protein
VETEAHSIPQVKAAEKEAILQRQKRATAEEKMGDLQGRLEEMQGRLEEEQKKSKGLEDRVENFRKAFQGLV